MDFLTNPYATVLIPEPMDYFSACSATSMCEAKCRAEFAAFDRQLDTRYSEAKSRKSFSYFCIAVSMAFLLLSKASAGIFEPCIHDNGAVSRI